MTIFNGTNGNDILPPVGEDNSGNDYFYPGTGRDSVSGGAGNDTLIIDYSIGDTGLGMQMNTYSDGSGYAYRSDIVQNPVVDVINFSSIEQFNVTGTSKNDTIKTGAGNDIINAGAGDDIVNGGGGIDTLDGGAGTDTLNLDLSAQTANLNITNYQTSGINLPGVVTATNFEALNLSTGAGNDTVTQSGLVNGVVIRGNDYINTGAGNDTINAGLGADTVNGGDGNDTLTIDYSIGDTGLGIQMNSSSAGNGFANRLDSTQRVFLDNTYFNNIEQFNVAGTSQNDTINTGAGNDTINGGGGGADKLFGGAGNDTYIVSRILGGGTVITDFSGTNDTLSLIGGASLSTTHISRSDTTLIVDLNQDGIFNLTTDLSISSYFANNTGSAAGTGFIENLAGLSGSKVLNTSTPSDFNNDGKSDILWRNQNGDVALWQMNGSNLTTGSVFANVSTVWTISNTGDFNGDSKSDILWRNQNGDVALWQMNGNTPTTQTVIGSAPTNWQISGTGDFNGDSKADILWRNTNDGSVAIWQMNGNTPTAQTVVGAASTDWKISGTGDFNGDGKSDLLWRNANGDVAMWQMNGTTPSSQTVFANVSTDWQIAGTGDFNGDGKSDLLWRNTNGSVAIWQMDGTTSLSQSLATPYSSVDNSWKISGTSDFNGDGKSDILWRNDNGSVETWLMNGSTVTAANLVSPNPVVDNTWKIAAPIL
jgi:RTX calcium-binding nonapeptide repeat (4 copies)/FG-GAP-like repeat